MVFLNTSAIAPPRSLPHSLPLPHTLPRPPPSPPPSPPLATTSLATAHSHSHSHSSTTFCAPSDQPFGFLWVVARFSGRSMPCVRLFHGTPSPHTPATPHTNHHYTLTHPQPTPNLPLAEPPPPLDGLPTPNHPVEAHTPLHSSLTHSHPGTDACQRLAHSALRALQATDSEHFGVTGRARMHFFRVVAL